MWLRCVVGSRSRTCRLVVLAGEVGSGRMKDALVGHALAHCSDGVQLPGVGADTTMSRFLVSHTRALMCGVTITFILVAKQKTSSRRTFPAVELVARSSFCGKCSALLGGSVAATPLRTEVCQAGPLCTRLVFFVPRALSTVFRRLTIPKVAGLQTAIARVGDDDSRSHLTA